MLDRQLVWNRQLRNAYPTFPRVRKFKGSMVLIEFGSGLNRISWFDVIKFQVL